MAIKEFYVGTVGPFLIDEDDPLYSHPTQVSKLQDIADELSSYVPTSRKINGKALANDITLNVTDILGSIPFSGTITTAKLTSGGTEGSITFTNGIVTAQTAAT